MNTHTHAHTLPKSAWIRVARHTHTHTHTYLVLLICFPFLNLMWVFGVLCPNSLNLTHSYEEPTLVIISSWIMWGQSIYTWFSLGMCYMHILTNQFYVENQIPYDVGQTGKDGPQTCVLGAQGVNHTKGTDDPHRCDIKTLLWFSWYTTTLDGV